MTQFMASSASFNCPGLEMCCLPLVEHHLLTYPTCIYPVDGDRGTNGHKTGGSLGLVVLMNSNSLGQGDLIHTHLCSRIRSVTMW